MSGIMKVFLLLAVMVCISKAQLTPETGVQCLCLRVSNRIISRNHVKYFQIYSATIFCDKVEIVVTLNNGRRYCLNPMLKTVQGLMASLETSTAARPTELTSTLD
ncbi:C-X-C motif chemokine 10-like isoform 3-T3 [Lycodopsis pacificus]